MIIEFALPYIVHCNCNFNNHDSLMVAIIKLK